MADTLTRSGADDATGGNGRTSKTSKADQQQGKQQSKQQGKQATTDSRAAGTKKREESIKTLGGLRRHSFARLGAAPELPDLVAIQTASYRWLIEEGLAQAFAAISPLTDHSGSLALEFQAPALGEPTVSLEECRERDLTYQAPLTALVRLVNRDTGELIEQPVFLGDFPLMTKQGTFVVNGTERVVVSQLVRSPGAYLLEPKEAGKQVAVANVLPQRGSWLELEIDKKGLLYARVDRKRKLPLTTLLRALPAEDPQTGFRLGADSNEAILALFDGSALIARTLEKDPTETPEQAMVELFKRQRPGEPPTLDGARALVRQLFFDPDRYDLGPAGRYQLNRKLGLAVAPSVRTLTTEDLLALARRLAALPERLGLDLESSDLAAAAQAVGFSALRDELDEYEHFGNRRLRTTGELLQEATRVGLTRLSRLARERMTTEELATMTPRTLINIRPLTAAMKEFLGSSQLSQLMDQTNALSGLTHRRRLSALGQGGLTRERAPLEVRDVHPTHYGRMCPIETPEGPNIGLMGTLATMATVSPLGFLQTPYRRVADGQVSAEIVYLDAAGEEGLTIAQASEPLDEQGRFVNERVLCRQAPDEAVSVAPPEVDYMDVSPTQVVSVGTALIPFLEHDDANRALMGANMQRQAVPLMTPQAPLVGTGLEHRAAVDSGDVVVASQSGTVTQVEATEIVVEGRAGVERHPLVKFRRSNQGTLIHQRPVVRVGDKVLAGQLLADGASSDQGDLALGANLLVAFMPFEGYNFEDAIVISERLVKDDVLTSIHIEEYETEARQTKLGDEEVTRDIPNLSEATLAQLDERGVVRVGAEVAAQSVLVGKVTPKGETELTAEERLIRAIFKEKAREVRDTSLRVPHGEGGVVIDVKTFSREDGHELKPGVNELVRVYVAQKRKIAEGDKLAGRHGNKGVISRIVPEEDMPFLEDGRSIDIVLNPLGVPSRMNIGQILETHLGLAAAQGAFAGSSPNPRSAINASQPTAVATPIFDGARPADIDAALAAVVGSTSGKARVYDGRSGRPYAQEVTVGFMYVLKLLHLVDDKIHARSTGPYSLVTQQPLGGKAQFGGQRFGEMEVWALEAHGAAYTLQEMLTVKSDDTAGRVRAYEAIVKGEDIPPPSLPESFKVLVKEMQALGLDLDVVAASERERTSEDDEILRAAQELGLDLSDSWGPAAAEASDQAGTANEGTPGPRDGSEQSEEAGQ